MDRVAIVGLSIHDADVSELEQLATHDDDASSEELVRELADEVAASELVLLRTCNRLEVIFARESGTPPGAADLRGLARVLRVPEELQERLHFSRGRAAARYLFRVVSSLESLVVGEDQILAQYERAISGQEEKDDSRPVAAEKVEVANERTDQKPLEGKTLEEVAELHLRDSFWNP